MFRGMSDEVGDKEVGEEEGAGEDNMKGPRNDEGSTRNLERKASGRRRLRYDGKAERKGKREVEWKLRGR
jgi:hypothetical protein